MVLFFAQIQVKTKKKRSSLKSAPIFSPKSGEDQPKKGLHPKLVPFFCPKSGAQKGQGGKKFWPNLNATTSTLPGSPRPGPGYHVPPEPPSRRPWLRSLKHTL